MPQYDDAMLDHLAVGVKNVFWPDQPITPKTRARTYSARSLLASLRKHHRDCYTVSTPTSTTQTLAGTLSSLPPRDPNAPRQYALNRSRSYTEARISHVVSSPTWSCTPSPTLPQKRLSPANVISGGLSTPSSLDSNYPYVSVSPVTPPSVPTGIIRSLSTSSCPRGNSISPTPTPPSTPISGRSPVARESKSVEDFIDEIGRPPVPYRHDRQWSEDSVGWVSSSACGSSPSPPRSSSSARCFPPIPSRNYGRSATAPGSPTEFSTRHSIVQGGKADWEDDEIEGKGHEVDGDHWVLCTLGRPCGSGAKNRRVLKMNQMSMEKNAEQYRKWLKDNPKPSKGGSFIRALSFKSRLGGKFSGMKSPLRPQGPGSRIVKVEPSQTNESLESKVEHVWRALDFYKDVVDKSSSEMLPGSATVVLEMIVALNLALKPCFVNQNSSAVASVIARVHQSVAELVRWSDQLLLYGEEAQNTQTVHQVVQAVRVAVQALIDLAADKENLNTSDSSILDVTPSSIDNNNTVNFEKSSPYYSNRNSDSVSSNHRNSLPEIKADSPVENRSFLSPRDSIKLTHSQSSDSILNSSDAEPPPPKPPLPGGRMEVAPPLPPKTKSHGKGAFMSDNVVANPMYLTSPLGHSSPLNRSPRESSSDWSQHSLGSASFTASLDRVSRASHSSDQMSPASSLDSMNQSQEEPHSVHQRIVNSYGTLQDQFDLNFERALHKNLGLGLDNHNPFGHSLDIDSSSLFPDSGFPSISSLQSSSSNSAFNSISSSHSFSHSVKQSCTQTHISSSSQGERENHILSVVVPPALPAKKSRLGRQILSTYENVDTDSVDAPESRLRLRDDPSPKLPPKVGTLLGSSSSSSTSSVSSGHMSSTVSMVSNSSTNSSQGSNVVLRRHTAVLQTQHGSNEDDENPPPLPLKKKHVMDYMKLFGQVAEPNENELLRHSVHQMHLISSSDWFTQENELELIHSAQYSEIITGMDISMHPPELPPKQNKRLNVPAIRQSLPATPKLIPISYSNDAPRESSLINFHRKSTEEKDEPEEVLIRDQVVEVDRKSLERKDEEVVEEKKKEELEEEDEKEGPLDLLDVTEYLIYKKEGEEGPDIRGGPVDALIVHASKANQRDFLYQEAFLTTYRTFISPGLLIEKLLNRYHKFIKTSDMERQKAARNAFSLLVRVVDDLAITDLNMETLETLTNFEYNLLCRGELLLARALRKKIVEKLEARKRYHAPKESLCIASLGITTKQAYLLEFKSREIAEQMTLLDAELFDVMEIPEVLLWAQEQNEEKSPNLTTFTEHFNKMSYWARSRILEHEDARDREKCVMKFIKIMKHLRNANNFNSYLAILSALDSAPIRRLEWQKNITDGLKEYCALIDSSCAFRAYRQALSETSPPCIPYIGLILQDLTFVNIGNTQFMPDGNVNFSKRWQQYNILDNMKRFKKCQYPFKKNEKIIAFFNNFDDYLNEEALWHISESIKPRGGKKK
ncbi:rap guanine nucleotide exchange factor 1-like isoform X2 [Macrobrachium nipponense]|uniref:rap guanine nucleotide exchange factor 1-like isoform X2 n=1 Tax=Macrobrachium nipponense TaxID=159736 RepID=UPI0030C84997